MIDYTQTGVFNYRIKDVSYRQTTTLSTKKGGQPKSELVHAEISVADENSQDEIEVRVDRIGLSAELSTSFPGFFLNWQDVIDLSIGKMDIVRADLLSQFRQRNMDLEAEVSVLERKVAELEQQLERDTEMDEEYELLTQDHDETAFCSR